MNASDTGDQAEVAVVGGGWAGIAAAVDLALAGRRVALFEAAPALGGRAREVPLALAGEPLRLDNGQHLMIGAYRACLRTIGIVAGGESGVLLRRPMRLADTGGLRLALPPLPAPLHLAAGLVAARGLPLAHRVAIVRMMARLKHGGWQPGAARTVADLLETHRQPAALRERLWEPLCLAALNTAAHEACAHTFLNVLRDSLGADARAGDFLLPRTTLSDVLPGPAQRWLEARGAALHLRTTVRMLLPAGGGWTLFTDRGAWRAAALVLAVPPFAALRLLQGASAARPEFAPLLAALGAFDYESIATVYLGWPASAAPALPAWTMLREEPGRGRHGQWLFDRGIHGGCRVAAVVVSARGRAADVGTDALAEGIRAQVAEQLRIAEPPQSRTIVEKRATFRCVPGRPRLAPDAFARFAAVAGGRPFDDASGAVDPFARLFIAGDHAWPDYPATLESAVRSAAQAASLADAALGGAVLRAGAPG